MVTSATLLVILRRWCHNHVQRVWHTPNYPHLYGPVRTTCWLRPTHGLPGDLTLPISRRPRPCLRSEC